MVERLNRLLLYTYGIPDMFFVLMISMELYYFPAFLTDHAQFSLAIFGQVLVITSLIDIVFALVGGVILQKVTLRYGGKYRSWFLIGPPIIAPLFTLQFTKIGSDAAAALIIIFGFVTSHLIFNVVFAASGSMLGRLSQLPDERTVLSASRAQGMSVAGLLFSFSGPAMITFFGGRTNEIAGHTITAAVFAVLMILGYWYIYAVTRGKDPYDEPAMDPSRAKGDHSIRDIVGLVFKNPPLLVLIPTLTFSSMIYFSVTAFAIYYFTYVLDNPEFLSLFILAISIARIIGTFAAAWIGVKIGKRRTYWVFLVLAAAGFASARFLGETAWSFTAIFCVATMLSMIATSMSTALYSDSVIYGEWKTGKNIRAFIMALMNFPVKVGVLLRSTVLTIGLMAIGFVANAIPTPEVTDGIRSLITLVPATAAAGAAVIFYLGYKIEDKQILQMQEEIAARTNQVSIDA